MPAFIQAGDLGRALEPCHSQRVLEGLSRVCPDTLVGEKNAGSISIGFFLSEHELSSHEKL
jgi:hypothetical protein